MTNKELINFKVLSKMLTGSDRTVRKNKPAKKYVAAIQELDDLIQYWKKRNNI